MEKPVIQVDAIKLAYRQNKDGFVVSFVIHPNDEHKKLANAAIGSQWQLRLVELDDDGNAPSSARDVVGQSANVAAPRAEASKERRPFTSLPLPQQAALLCQDPVFWAFINEEWKLNDGQPYAIDTETAAEAIRMRYCIHSRSELGKLELATKQFVADREQFAAWKLVA